MSRCHDVSGVVNNFLHENIKVFKQLQMFAMSKPRSNHNK